MNCTYACFPTVSRRNVAITGIQQMLLQKRAGPGYCALVAWIFA
jgi:hypothetical protein